MDLDFLGEILELVIALLIIFGGRIARWLHERRQRREAARTGTGGGAKTRPTPTVDADVEVEPEDARSGVLARAALVLGRLGQIEAAVRENVDEARALLARLSSGPPQIRVMAPIVADRILPELESTLRRLTELKDTQQKNEAEALFEALRSSVVDEAVHTLRLNSTRLGLLRDAADWRADPRLGPFLADADAVAEALLEPFTAFANAQGIRFPRQHPICVPTDPGHEAVWFGLAPDHPVIFVPDDFGMDLYRWPAVAHEIGHLVFRRVPGLEEEIRAVTGLELTPVLPRIDGSRIHFNPEAALSGWLEEIFPDVLTAVQLGPAALRGFIEVFEESAEPARATLAYTTDGRTFGPHPPPALRVRLVARLLEYIGYDQEVDALRKTWAARHGHAAALESILLPSRAGTLLEAPMQVMEEAAWPVVLALYEGSWQALSGRSIESIAGFDMSPGVWARTQRVAEGLAGGRPESADPRVLLAAAMEARATNPAKGPIIAEALRRSILGRDMNERRVADAAYALPQSGASHGGAYALPRPGGSLGAFSMVEIRDALVLRDVLTRAGR
jgi:hypothetical protein